MEYDRGDNFPFDFEPNGIPSGWKLKGKLSPRSYSMQFERKLKSVFVSVQKSKEKHTKLFVSKTELRDSFAYAWMGFCFHSNSTEYLCVWNFFCIGTKRKSVWFQNKRRTVNTIIFPIICQNKNPSNYFSANMCIYIRFIFSTILIMQEMSDAMRL